MPVRKQSQDRRSNVQKVQKNIKPLRQKAGSRSAVSRISSSTEGKVVATKGKSQRRFYEINGKRIPIRKGSFLDRIIDAVGIVKGGPADLSTNKAYFKGFGL